ncbi:MAG: hypothetical protein ABS34_05255 [Opitutaceae bacterium BACL24 MAG-120322-bin51]|jgi:hypothetical protein|nr:MAG: hypothetical protein ABS34_05255 [Opitutaceae bacterium BACL24 MAG-120322-bin51]
MLHDWREKSGAVMPVLHPDCTLKNDYRGPISSFVFYTPKQDHDGLKANADLNVDLPNVLIIGDSISIGYMLPVAVLFGLDAVLRRALSETSRSRAKRQRGFAHASCFDFVSAGHYLHFCYFNSSGNSTFAILAGEGFQKSATASSSMMSR